MPPRLIFSYPAIFNTRLRSLRSLRRYCCPLRRHAFISRLFIARACFRAFSVRFPCARLIFSHPFISYTRLRSPCSLRRYCPCCPFLALPVKSTARRKRRSERQIQGHRHHIPPISSFHIRLSRISRLRSYFHSRSFRIYGSARHARSAANPPPGIPLRRHTPPAADTHIDTIPDFPLNRSP